MFNRNFVLSIASLLASCFLCSNLSGADSSPVIEIHAQVRIANMVRSEDSEANNGQSESTQLAIKLLEEAGLAYEFSLSPWTRIFQLLESRPNILTYPIARTADREGKVFWIGMMRPLQLSLYGLRENMDQLPTTLEAATEFKIGVLRDDAIDRFLVSQGFENIVRFSNLENSLDMLQRGRFDLFPFEAVGIERTLMQENLSQDLVVPMIPLDAISTESFFALSLATDEDIKQRLRAAYTKIVDNGTFAEIMGFEHNSQFTTD